MSSISALDEELSEKYTFQYRHIIRRNWWVYKRFLISRLMWNLFAPTITLLAFGLGVGYYIKDIEVAGRSVNYLTFIAPGLISFTTAMVASADTTWGAYIRLEFQKTFDAQIATPVNIRDVIIGEVIYASIASEIACLGMLTVAVVLGAPLSPLFLLTPILALFGSIVFASLGILWTAYSYKIETFTYFFEGFLLPAQFLSGAFFALDILPKPLQDLSALLPLTHVVNSVRFAFIGIIDPVQIITMVGICSVVSIVSLFFAYRKFYKRMVT